MQTLKNWTKNNLDRKFSTKLKENRPTKWKKFMISKIKKFSLIYRISFRQNIVELDVHF